MTDIVLQVVMLVAAIVLGYSFRALQKPLPKRGPNGRFIKR